MFINRHIKIGLKIVPVNNLFLFSAICLFVLILNSTFGKMEFYDLNIKKGTSAFIQGAITIN